MINYSIAMRPNPLDENAQKKAYAQAQSIQTLDIIAFAKHISDHGCVYDRGDIANILTKAVDCMKENLLNGNRVQLAELGTFSVSLNSKGADSAQDFTAANITNVNVIWTPGNEFKDLIREAQFNVVPTRKATAKLIAAQKAGESIVDLSEEDTTSNGGGGSQSQGGGNTGSQQGGGGQQQTSPKYTLTLKKANGDVISTCQLEAGATISYPTATSGYMWPADAPTVMPAEATVVTEVVDDDPNVL